MDVGMSYLILKHRLARYSVTDGCELRSIENSDLLSQIEEGLVRL